MEKDPREEKKEQILKHTGWAYSKDEGRRSSR